jgi:hypothetical protein
VKASHWCLTTYASLNAFRHCNWPTGQYKDGKRVASPFRRPCEAVTICFPNGLLRSHL